MGLASISSEVVICGAGMAGIAAAYHLAVRGRVKDIVLVDEREPLTLTSNKGTEAYRNWWPGPGDTMVRFVNRSIDLLEELARETDNCFQMNRRGYVFLTADDRQIPVMKDELLLRLLPSVQARFGSIQVPSHTFPHRPKVLKICQPA